MRLALALLLQAIQPGDTVRAVVLPPPAPVSPCGATGGGVCHIVDGLTLDLVLAQVQPGDVVTVQAGVYTGGTVVLAIARSGTPDAWITVRSAMPWQAIIDGRGNLSAGGIQVTGNYVHVEGFEVRGTSRYGIEAYRGDGLLSHVAIVGNHVHDVGRRCTSESGGMVGINAYASNLVIEQNVIHDVGRFAAGEQGCQPTNTYWQNHDHGIYHGQGDSLVVRDNVFYNLRRGWAYQRYGQSVTGVRVEGNTFIGANPYRDGHLILASATTGFHAARNLFVGPRGAAVWVDATVTGELEANVVSGANLLRGLPGLVLIGNQVTR